MMLGWCSRLNMSTSRWKPLSAVASRASGARSILLIAISCPVVGWTALYTVPTLPAPISSFAWQCFSDVTQLKSCGPYMALGSSSVHSAHARVDLLRRARVGRRSTVRETGEGAATPVLARSPVDGEQASTALRLAARLGLASLPRRYRSRARARTRRDKGPRAGLRLSRLPRVTSGLSFRVKGQDFMHSLPEEAT